MCAGNPRRDTPSAQAKQRILRIRCFGAFLEPSSLDPPPAALRLFPCAIEILSFQNFYKVLKTCSARRKDFFDTLRRRALPVSLFVRQGPRSASRAARAHSTLTPLLICPIMLRRNLLYTAVTRAKSKVILIGQRQAVYIAIHKCDVGQRNTVLADRIVAYFNREMSKRVA